jgi:hypothetical protein
MIGKQAAASCICISHALVEPNGFLLGSNLVKNEKNRPMYPYKELDRLESMEDNPFEA